MQYETLYDGTDIPVIGLGTWRIGGGMVPDRSQDEAYVRTLRTALDLGYRHIDTAEMYGDGHTEKLIGRAIQDVPRSDLFLTSKVWRTNLRYRNVLTALEGSLERLETDYLDLYLIHWPNPSIPMEETFRAFNELVDDGRVKRVGVSNFDLQQLKRAQRLSDSPIATNQVEYHVLSREPERTGVVEYCRENDIVVTAYSPLGKGSVMRNGTIRRIAREHGVTPAQIAIAWLIRKPKVITIPKSLSEQHLRENLEAIDLALSTDELAELDGLQ